MKIGDPAQVFSQMDLEDEQLIEYLGHIEELLKPGDTFQFECDRSGICCRNRFESSIILSPYDVARLRRRLKISSEEFLRRYAHLNLGAQSQLPIAWLRFEEEKPRKNKCPFLRSYGCGVYEGRPLRCRLYPVGRVAGAEGMSYFFLMKVSSYCGLGKGKSYTLEEWLEEAQVEPFCDWTDRYFQVIREMDHQKYRSLDDRIKFSLCEMMYDFDGLVSRMVEEGGIEKPGTDEEILSIVLEALGVFAERFVGVLEGEG